MSGKHANRHGMRGTTGGHAWAAVSRPGGAILVHHDKHTVTLHAPVWATLHPSLTRIYVTRLFRRGFFGTPSE